MRNVGLHGLFAALPVTATLFKIITNRAGIGPVPPTEFPWAAHVPPGECHAGGHWHRAPVTFTHARQTVFRELPVGHCQRDDEKSRQNLHVERFELRIENKT